MKESIKTTLDLLEGIEAKIDRIPEVDEMTEDCERRWELDQKIAAMYRAFLDLRDHVRRLDGAQDD